MNDLITKNVTSFLLFSFHFFHPQVGKIYKSGGEVFIKEAGEVDCIRGEDPLISGMKITKQGEVLFFKLFPQLLPQLFFLQPIVPCLTFPIVFHFLLPQPLVHGDHQYHYTPHPPHHLHLNLNLRCQEGTMIESQQQPVQQLQQQVRHLLRHLQVHQVPHLQLRRQQGYFSEQPDPLEGQDYPTFLPHLGSIPIQDRHSFQHPLQLHLQFRHYFSRHPPPLHRGQNIKNHFNFRALTGLIQDEHFHLQ